MNTPTPRSPANSSLPTPQPQPSITSASRTPATAPASPTPASTPASRTPATAPTSPTPASSSLPTPQAQPSSTPASWTPASTPAPAPAPDGTSAAKTPPVSVVVPVYNPGPSLTRCLESLTAQTLPGIEIICVDDGSTDGSAQRLDEFAARFSYHAPIGQHHLPSTTPSQPASPHYDVPHRQRPPAEPRPPAEQEPASPVIRVIHTPNSGWPGTPRNIGAEAATGEYVHFVDNDDVLPPYALADLYAAATADRADVAFGRAVSDFRGVNHAVYRRDLRGVTLAEHPELAEALTPHRMFRRRFLVDNGIRFPEHKVPLEDHPFVLHAYLAARSITVLTTRPYYFYLRRLGSGRNAGDAALDIDLLADPLAQVAGMIDAVSPPPPLADLVRRRELRLVLLSRLTAASFADADRSEQERVIRVVRELTDRYLGGPSGVPAGGLGAVHRVLLGAAFSGIYDGVRTMAARTRELDLVAEAAALSWQGPVLTVELDSRLDWRGEPLRCERLADGWALPAEFAGGAPEAARKLGRGADPTDAELALVHRQTRISLGITDGITVGCDREGTVRIRGRVRIDPEAAGALLDEGVWELRLRLYWEGMQLDRAVALPRPADPGSPDDLAPARLAPRVVRPYRMGRAGALALDIGQSIRSVAHVLAPGLVLSATPGGEVALDPPGPATLQGASWELVLVPESGTAGGVLTISGDGAGRFAFPAPRRVRMLGVTQGCWQPYLRLAGSRTPPALLGQRIVFSGTWGVVADTRD